MTQEESDYLRRREQQERAAAKAALSLSVRRAHQHLAECYCALLNGEGPCDPLPFLRKSGLI